MAKILKTDPDQRSRRIPLATRIFNWLRKMDQRHRVVQGMISAVQFLTIFPLRWRHDFNARAALPYFPICGLVIGMAVMVVDALAGLVWPRPVVAMVDVVALAVFSGALHLDGLADTADGLYGRREPEQALAIMKDSRVGAMGLVVVVCTLGLKWVALANLANSKVYLFMVPAYARATILFGMKFLPYGRPGSGTGHDFFTPPLRLWDFWSVGVLAVLSLATTWGFIPLNIGFAGIVLAAILWYRHKINCITGDMLGALVEVTETGLFLLAASRWAA